MVFEDRRLSYGELNARANQLAHHLIAQGVGPDVRVGVCLERSFDLVIALLGVLKAGGAFVPLDPDYPADRLAFMLEDAALPVVVSHHQLPLPPHHATQLQLDAHEAFIARCSAHNPTRSATPRHAAYVIYTSGSTGMPKGVIVSHAAACNNILWFSRTVGLGVSDRLLQKTSISFDAAFHEFFSPLTSGATVVLALPGGQADTDYLVRTIQQQRISLVSLVPTLLRALTTEPSFAQCESLRYLIVGGEALDVELVGKVRDRLPAVAIGNFYGPTEAACNSTHHLIGNVTDYVDTIPIGRPISNARCYVLDHNRQLVPAGMPGELYIGGAGLARGYLNRPELDTEYFVPDPFQAGERMYRTGDLARWRPDGVLDFLGRADQQVKIRGFRIELGEIEAALVGLPGVAQTAVIAREDTPGHKQLVGYVVTQDDLPVDAQALRRALSDFLPEHMVPAAIVVLPALPLTPNGKLDRRALPAPDFTPQSIRAPRTPQEEILATLFAEILHLPQVGIDDNFFDLGGDSISSIQLVSRARKAGLLITPRGIFQHQNVKAIASAATSLDTQGILEDVATGTLPLMPIAHWLLDANGPMAQFNQSMLLQVPADMQELHLSVALHTLVAHHDALRMRLVPARRDAGAWQLEIASAKPSDVQGCLQRVDIDGLDDTSRRSLIAGASRAAAARLDPEAGRMLQATWFDAGSAQPGRLLLTIHHLAVDGVSWRILVPDLELAWRAALHNERAKLGPRGSSLRHWALRLNAEALSARRLAELPLWQSIVGASDPLLSHRPLDATRDTVATARRLTLSLPSTLTSALLTQVPALFHGRINDVLLTAFALAVAHWRRRRSSEQASGVLFDLEGHGREEIFQDIDLSRTVGWFTSIFPMRLDLQGIDLDDALRGGPHMGRALKQSKEQLRALPDNGLGFGLLRYLNPETSKVLAGATPQIGFNYLGRFAAPRAQDWAAAPEASGLGGSRNQDMPLAHAIDMNALVRDRIEGPELHASWAWASELFGEEDIRDLAKGWFDALEALVSHAQRSDAGGFTPSDFPLLTLAQPELERLEQQHPLLEEILPLSALQQGLLFHAL
ncbi:amino acid adenylation domain-containing protein/non-ribosomal peptide synthase protein (TIGR01720 family), partial [Variovorax boronicumulans]|nr:amino acid adenylation domain-containing protein/non-ribosomal peptide synthase protein (TIGR01720 family) [Variovorax boronicumulans]